MTIAIMKTATTLTIANEDGDDQDSDGVDSQEGENDAQASGDEDGDDNSDDDAQAAAADDESDTENIDDPDDDHGGDDKPAAHLDADTPSISAEDDSGDAEATHDDEFAEDVADDHDSEDSVSEDDVGENDADDDEETAADEPAEAGGAGKNRGARAKRAELLERYKEARRKRARLVRSYKIQEVVKRRQILLIQVVKEERGNKGAALTTYLSLAGRYCVLMPNTARGGGISRKIPHSSDRKRLRRIVDGLDVGQGMGLIIRTAGAKRTKPEVKRDYEYLTRLWETIRALTLKSIAPCLIYEEASLIKRAIRDLYDKDIASVLVEGDAGYREAKDFMKMLMPSHAKNVQPYKEKLPLFIRHDVEGQLDAMYQPVVRLRSGGYLVINQTEALIAIDVNSGKATRERNIELTALKTNLEAAKEAARQFRLRDLAGLIVIDFIDMEENRNNRSVEKKLKDALKHDRARIQVGRISNFGLLEMSRQRRRSGIIDGTTNACPTCAGAGVVRSHEMAALRILRAIESEAIAGRAGTIIVKSALDVTLYMLNYKREWLRRIEEDCAVTIEAVADETKAGDQYEIEKKGAPRPRADQPVHVRADQPDPAEIDADGAQPDDSEERSEASSEDGEKTGKRRRRRRRRKKEGAPDGEHSEQSTDEDRSARGAEDGGENSAEDGGETRGETGGENDGEQPDIAARDEENEAGEDKDGEERPKRRRRRGRRGGRRNARNAAAGSENAATDKDGENKDGADKDGADNNEQPAIADLEASGRPEQEASGRPTQEDAASDEGLAPDQSQPADVTDGAPDVIPDASVESATESDQPVVMDVVSARSVAKKSKSGRKGWWQKAIGG